MKKYYTLILLLWLIIYILPLGVRPIVIPDESRYAEIAREMKSSGDWTVPHLNGLRYFEKPVMGYWLNTVSMMLFGENAFAVRFASAVSAGISALIIFILVRRFSGRYSKSGAFSISWEPLLAAVIFLTCLEVYAVAVFSVLDSMLSMFITGAMASFFFAYMENSPLKKSGFLLLFGICCGLAFLTKGFLAFAVPVISIVPFMIWERKEKCLLKLVWIPIIAILIISLPWSLMIHIRENDFWHSFFWNEHIRRFMAENAQHSAPIWFFIPVIAGGSLPWMPLFPAAVSGLRKSAIKSPLLRFALCWLLFPFLFFSIAKGKLLTYILPCFPPVAILAASGLLTYLENGEKKALTNGLLFIAGLTITVVFALVINRFAEFEGFKAYGAGESWKWIVSTAGLGIWIFFIAKAVKQTSPEKKLVLFCAAPLIFMFSAHFIFPDLIRMRKSPGDFLLRHVPHISPDTAIISCDDDLVPAICWFYKRNDIIILNTPGELGYGLKYDDAGQRLFNTEDFSAFIKNNFGKKHIVFISETEDYEKYRALIPEPECKDSNGWFVFACFSHSEMSGTDWRAVSASR
jgi:4-amino-4-deoxy-L-arabinose transferase